MEENSSGKIKREEWWSWGAGTHGQLGTGAFHDELTPQSLHPPSGSRLVHLACGGSHAVAVFGNGEAMTWGNNSSGQLGHGDLQNRCEPRLVRELQWLKIKTAAAGWSHSAFISDDQKLFTFGSGGYGQLGHGDLDSCNIPRQVICFTSMKVCHVACGMRHTLALVESEEGTEVYAFGASRKGQLGIELSERERPDKGFLGNNCNVYPSLVGSLIGYNIVSIHANGDHSAALTDYGGLYVWGRGFDSTNNITLPLRVSNQLNFSQVALGWNHLMALTYDGQVYATGRSQKSGALNGLAISGSRL
ncbi:hypothetical protein KP509_14G085200 [Ceratopteris richardii]|uniref:Ultraviolet-B receptor UVR8 n=1 Tax=Ceratopteris richardii TaxID=49495 RepID=A0A8T2T9X6_CERRI|nr:hypothetical protein KP509_14G085200 [Ceratopteris richardii]